MTPESLLQVLCERNGVPYSSGERLLPLVRRALEAPEQVRDRILILVDRNLREQSPEGGTEKIYQELEEEILVAVAKVLHDWTPSEPLLDLGSTLGGLSFQNPEST